MLKKIQVKNVLNDKIYDGYHSDNNPFNVPLFTKNTMKKIIEETNQMNQSFHCNIFFIYDKNGDKVICKDNEFHSGIENSYNSHMVYTSFGLMKLYNFGNEIEFEKIL